MPAAAQHGPYPGEKLLGREGLDHVVVGADLEPEHAIDLVTLGGQHHDGQRGGRGILAEAPAHLEAVHRRHHEVEQDEIRRGRLHLAERLFAAGGRRDLVAFPLEMMDDELADVRLVLHDQHAARHGGAILPAPPRSRPEPLYAVFAPCRLGRAAGKSPSSRNRLRSVFRLIPSRRAALS